MLLFYLRISRGFGYAACTMVSEPEKIDGRVVRAKERRESRKTDIVLAGRKVFALHGYHSASITHILEAAQISRGTFYQYFESKRGILAELLTEFLDKLSQAIQPVKIDEPENPVARQFIKILTDLVDIVFDNEDLTWLLSRESLGNDDEFDAQVNQFYTYVRGLIAGALADGQKMGIVRTHAHPEVLGLCILGSFKEVLFHLLMKPQWSDNKSLLIKELLSYNLAGTLVLNFSEDIISEFDRYQKTHR
jgi:AcrR family transcriptional regulator